MLPKRSEYGNSAAMKIQPLPPNEEYPLLVGASSPFPVHQTSQEALKTNNTEAVATADSFEDKYRPTFAE